MSNIVLSVPKTDKDREPVAIVGMGCRLPGANGIREYIDLLRHGKDAITETPPDRFNVDDYYNPEPGRPGKLYCKQGGFIDRVHEFDPLFFGISIREAERADPQQRLLLQVAWEAIEDAGFVPSQLAAAARVGVYVGCCYSEFLETQLARLDSFDFYRMFGGTRSGSAGRLSHALGVRGPSLIIDVACASSLVAVHLAVQALRSGECQVALAAGSNLILHPGTTIGFAQARLLAKDGRCKAFASSADGFVRSDGVAAVILKPLSRALADHDRIYAVIRGSATLNDGTSDSSMITPSLPGQQAVLSAAYADAGVDPARVSYVETHGTGTPIGDPIEAQALGAVLGRGRPADAPCRLGSVKSNIGHTEATAGLAGLIKTALGLYHKELVPSLHCDPPSPAIAWDALRLRVQQHLEPWPEADGPRIAGVSAFGLSGGTAHVVLSEAPPPPPPLQPELPLPLPLSALDAGALAELARRYGDWLRSTAREPGSDALAALCHTAAVRRSPLPTRAGLLVHGVEDAQAQLDALASGGADAGLATGVVEPERPKVAFLFSGHGSQWPGMAAGLLDSSQTFRARVRECDAALAPHLERGVTMEGILRRQDPDDLARVELVHPLLFTVQLALAAHLAELGVQPDFVVGHSLGEVAAAAVSGALGLADAAQVIAQRSRLLREISGQGGMAVVELPAAACDTELARFGGRLAVAAVNSPESTVLAGEVRALQELVAELTARGIFCREVRVSVASHSPQVEPLRPRLFAALEGIAPHKAALPMISTVTAQPSDGADLDASYWVSNLRQAVLFGPAVARLIERGVRCFVELSPHPLLLRAVEQCLRAAGAEGLALPSLRREQGERETLLASLLALHCRGVAVRLGACFPEPLPPVSLPGYPFARMRLGEAAAPLPRGLEGGLEGGLGVTPPQPASDGSELLGPALDCALEDQTLVFELPAASSIFADAADHQLLDEALVPAAGHIVMAHDAAAALLGSPAVSLRTVRIDLALFVRPGLRVQVVAQRMSEQIARVRIASKGRGDKSFCVHAQAEAEAAPAPSLPTVRHDLDAIGARCRRGLGAEAFYETAASCGLRYGPRMGGILEVRLGDNEALAGLDPGHAPQSAQAAERVGFLDSCLQALLASLTVGADGADEPAPILPVAVGEVALRGTLGEARWAWVRLRDEADGTSADIRVLDAAGTELAELHGVQVRRLARPRDLSRCAFTVEWQPAPPRAQGAPIEGALIIRDARGVGAELARILRARGVPVAEAELGSGFMRHGPGSYRFDPAAPGDAVRLLRTLASDGLTASWIVHLAALDVADEPVAAELAEAYDRGAVCALHILQGLVEVRPQLGGTHLILCSRGAHAVPGDRDVAPLSAPLWGLGAVIAQEHPELDCRRIDLPLRCADADAQALCDELTLDDQPEREVALRATGRHVARLVRAVPSRSPRGPGTVASSGACLITGGLGGLGLVSARRLVDGGARHLILLGRSAPGPMAEAVLSELRGRGAEIEVVQADASDAASLAKVFDGLAQRGVRLAGVIHAAGVLDDGVLTQQSRQRLLGVAGSKALGALHLHTLLHQQPLEYFVMFSSVAPLLGSPGQGNYCAANALLDALARHRSAAGLPAQSLAWGPWSEVGLAAQRERGTRLATQGLPSLTPNEGGAALGLWLGDPQPHVALTPLDIGRWQAAHPAAARDSLFAVLRAERSATVPTAGPPTTRQAPLDLGAATDRPQRVAQLLAEQCAQVLRMPVVRLVKLGPQLSLTRLGLDSLMAVELRSRIQSLFGLALPVSQLLRDTSLSRLTELVLEALPQPGPIRDPADDWEEGEL